jgi:hypothetical protein
VVQYFLNYQTRIAQHLVSDNYLGR